MRRVKLIVVGENAEYYYALLAVHSIFREEAELCVFGKYHRWALSPISVISNIGLSLISERLISD
jgi:hypothetical protein